MDTRVLGDDKALKVVPIVPLVERVLYSASHELHRTVSDNVVFPNRRWIQATAQVHRRDGAKGERA